MHCQYTTYIKQDALINIRYNCTTVQLRYTKNSTQWDTMVYYFYCNWIVVLSWPEDGRSRSKHVAKYYLIVIIASCLMYVVYWRCIIYYTNLIIHNGMASLKFCVFVYLFYLFMYSYLLLSLQLLYSIRTTHCQFILSLLPL